MTKRRQVLLGENELAEIQVLARRRHQATAAWVRDALRAARDTATRPDTLRKLGAGCRPRTPGPPPGSRRPAACRAPVE